MLVRPYYRYQAGRFTSEPRDVGFVLMWGFILFFFSVWIFSVTPASAPAKVSSVTVHSCWDVIPVFPDTLTGVREEKRKEKREGEGQ